MAEERLDVRLSREYGLTRSRVEALIADGRASVNGRPETKCGRKIRPDDTVALEVPPPIAAQAAPENIPLEILYEDDDLAVVVKPCGMVVHPAAGNESGRDSAQEQ